MDAAEALIDDIRAMKQKVPNFVIPESKAARRKLSRAASVPPVFVDVTAMAIRNNEELTRGGNSGAAQIRDRRSFAEAFNLVADELEAMALFVRHSVKVAQNEAGSIALTTYALAKRLAKRPETASLAPHVEDMRVALGSFIRKPKSKAKSKPTTAPANPGTSPATTQSSPAPETPATSPAPKESSPATTSSPVTPTKQ